MATINTGPAAVDTGATTTTIGPLDRAPGAVPPASDPGIPTSPPVYNRPVDRAPEPVEPGPGLGINTTATATPSVPVVELPVEEAAPAGAGSSVTVATPVYIKVLSDGTVVTENTIALNFLGTGVTVAANGSTANITITAGGASYGNSNVVSLMNAFGSNTISTTGNITGGYILGNGSQLTGLSATYGNSNVVTLLGAFGSNSISTTGNITGGNISAPDGNGSILINRSGVIGAAEGFSYDVVANAMFVPIITASGNSSTGINAIYAGAPGYVVLGSSVMAQFTGNVNAYSQINFQNISSGNRSSGDYILTANNGTDSTYYLDLGLAGSNHDDPAFFGDTSTKNDGYLYVNGNSQAGPAGGVGNLIVGSTNGVIKMFVGNTAQANVIATVSQSGMSVSGNVTGGNILTGGLISVTGNITSNNLIISSGIVGSGASPAPSLSGFSTISTTGAAGNISASGNLLAAGYVSATGNVTGGNLLTGGLISATGNITGGNITSAGLISTSGGLFAAVALLTDGSISSTGNITTAGTMLGSRLSLSSNVISTLNVDANITSNATITGTYLTVNGNVLVGVGAGTGNINSGNIMANGIVSATGNITSGNVTTAGLSVTGNTATVTTANYSIGYLNIPQVSLAANSTIALTDSGKHYYSVSASNLSLTIANNTSVAWPVGTAISIVNANTGNILINQGTGVSLYLAGNATAGNRVLSTFGMATIMNTAANTWFISGTGLT